MLKEGKNGKCPFSSGGYCINKIYLYILKIEISIPKVGKKRGKNDDTIRFPYLAKYGVVSRSN